MAGKDAAAPEIESALEAAKPAAGARIGESLVAVVDLLTVEARPVAAGDARAVVAGVRPCQRVTDTLLQRAQRRKAELSRDRLHDAIGRKLRSDDRPDAGRQGCRRRVERNFRTRWPWPGLRSRRHDETRTQEPIVGGAAAKAAAE
jgi:hypothetical protein